MTFMQTQTPETMGVVGGWVFLNKKGYEPILHQALPAGVTNPTYRVDLQACLFHLIRRAYTRHPANVAHHIVESGLFKIGSKETMVLYLDGQPAKEKTMTHDRRKKAQADAVGKAQKLLVHFEERITKSQRVRKQLFASIGKQIRKAFYWSLDDRKEFASFLEQNGWRVRIASTEADVKIARDTVPGDIVVTTDSDLLFYGTINTVIRPISKGRFLVYRIEDILNKLQLSRVQWTVLGIVSRNDYNHNVPSLGVESNYKIISGLGSEGKLEERSLW